MGTVYEAEQAQPRRRVAIKVLESASANALVRFHTEAQIMARLDHPGIARVLEAGDADGRPFLAMEYVDGTTLDRYAKDLPRERKLQLFAELCDPVHYAHLKGVIHRDLKPSNVMVTHEGKVVVLDFGIARLTQDDGSTPKATRAGELIGTPIYMSPEQAQLRADQVDARTDVYTLGVILYELLTGELPYEGSREAALPILTVLICDEPPVPPGKRDPSVRGDLEAIVMQALAKEPEQRYQSVAALADDVRRFLRGLPVSVRTPTALERARRFVKRRPMVAAAIGGSLTALVAFAGIVTSLWLDAQHAKRSLESRTNQLVLRTAREALGRDPTEAVAWLATMTERDVDPGAAWAIADEAIARGVAKDVLRAHIDEVHWVEPLGDGFVSGGYDGRVVVWDPRPRVVFAAPHGRVHVVVPSPDGKQLAIGGDDGMLVVVAPDGTMLARLDGHVGDVQHLAWSADGAQLASSDDHGNVYVWPHARAPGAKLESNVGSATDGLGIAPNGLVYCGDHAGDVLVWDVAAGTRRAALAKGEIVNLWSDGARVRGVDVTGVVSTWRIDASALVLETAVDSGLRLKRAIFAPDGTWALLGGVSGAVMRVEGERVDTLGMHHAQVRSLAISDDKRWIADGGDDGTLFVRDRATGRVHQLRGHTGRIRHVAFADRGRVLLSSDSDGVVRRWELSALPATVLETGGDPADKIAVDARGTVAAAVDGAGHVWRWEVASGARQELGRVDGRVTALAIAGGVVVTGTSEGALTWWSSPPVHREAHAVVKAIEASKDRVAVALSSGAIAMFDLGGEPRGELAGNPGGVEAIAFSPEGTLLASGGQDRAVRVWNVADGRQVAALDGPHGDTAHVVFAPGGELLVSAGNDGAVLGWRVAGGVVDPASRRVIAQHTGAVSALALARGWIATAGRDAVLVRVPTDGSALPDVTRIAAAAMRVAIDDDGTLHAITRTGAAVRWRRGQPPVMDVDHGVRDAARLSDRAAWLEAFDDGTLVLETLSTRSFDELRAAVSRATSYRL